MCILLVFLMRSKAVHSKVKKLNDKLNTMKLKSDVMREALAEFLGTFILVLFGNAVNAVLVFNKSSSSVAGPLGWGVSLMVAIAVTGGVSGCHANPAVTLAMASIGKFKWKKIMPYFFAQYFGAFVASIVLYTVYLESFSNFDGGHREVPPNKTATAQIFATYAADHVSVYTALGDQIVSSMVFIMAIVAITDPHNMSIMKGQYPLVIGLALSATIFAFPLNCGAPLNPARDLAPRIFTALAGWGKEVFSFREYNFFWVPVIGPHVGGILGAWIYRLCIELHWPVDSYDFGNPTEVKSNGEFKKKDDLPFVDKKIFDENDMCIELIKAIE
ncbi:aquaporin-9 isoform X3 [Parasteatoda tepidariorum]|uniref:aquaporin-9 isoform X3 n=1 Tax=Parasteatoda tepidariorum TaxID=114398 RepID=UPI00077FDC17|nr:aquaporin-9 isoform X3 [Parasteatoda tepidariorum]